MDCTETHRALVDGASLMSDSPLGRHVAECAACRAVVADRAAQARQRVGAAGSDTLFARLAADDTFVGRLKALPSGRRQAIALVFAAASFSAVLLWSRRPDLSHYPASRLALEGVGWFALVLAGVRLGLPALRRLPGVTTWSVLAVALMVPLVMGLLPPAHAAHPASLLGAGADFVPRALSCFVWGLVTGAPLALVMTLFERSAAADPPRDLIFGACAGALGGLCLSAHCPITHPEHLLAGHATVVPGAVAGYAAARWLLASLLSRRPRHR